MISITLPATVKVTDSFLKVPADQIAAGELSGIAIPGMQAYMALNRPTFFWNYSSAGREKFAALAQVQFLLVRRGDGNLVLLLPLISGNLRAFLRTDGESITLAWAGLAPAEKQADAELLAIFEGTDPYELVARGLKAVRDRLGTFRLREEKRSGEFVDYLGWCTWNAFYQDVTAEKVLAGLKSFADGGVRPGFIILDDGWLNHEEGFLIDLPPDPKKFPEGLAPVIRAAKRDYGVKMFGIWHAFEGHWRGLKPEGPLAKRYRTIANEGDISPWAPKLAPLYLIHPDDIARFYQEFHGYLRQQGVDFVKVDNQCAIEAFAKGKVGHVTTMQKYQQAFQGAMQVHFNGNAISCMSSGSDVAYNLLAASVFRNSDDYFPNRPESHGLHLQWNAMNALWTSQFSLPDWDMFWSAHPQGEFHAMSRAISGGPVYVSDEPAAHNFDILRKLITSDGRVLRSDRPALPSADSIFVDSTVEPKLLKLTNRTGDIGVLGLFNCRGTEGTIADSFCPADVHDLAGDEFIVRLHKAGTLSRVKRNERISVELPQFGCEIATLSPVLDGWIAPLGLLEKYNGPAAVLSCSITGESQCTAKVRDGGVVGFWCDGQPRVVAVSRESQIRYEDGLLRIETEPGEDLTIQITQ